MILFMAVHGLAKPAKPVVINEFMASNVQELQGIAADPCFAPGRGFYDAPIEVTLTTATPGAQIWYTLDATVPHQQMTLGQRVAWTGKLYSGPIQVSSTTCIRAVAVKTGYKDSQVSAHTYIFLDDVVQQSASPAGFPLTWGGRQADYAMDPRIVDDPAYADAIKDDLKSTPSVCIVIPNDDFFGAQRGIYSNPYGTGDDWERAATIEWIDPSTGGQFGVNAGLRSQGAVGRGAIKHGLRIAMRAEYGLSKLHYPLFEDTDVQEFDSLILRSIWNYSWVGDSGMNGPVNADYLRDVFARDTIRDMGGLVPHGRPVQVYVNGLYWGLYILAERPDDGFAAAHLGGAKEDYDVLKAPTGFGGEPMEVVSGDHLTLPPEWTTLFSMVKGDLSTGQAYRAIQPYVDVPALIDYMLMVFYTGSRDAPTLLGNDVEPRNFYAVRTHQPAGGWVFLAWDVEWSLEYPDENRVTKLGGRENPGLVFKALGANPDFRMEVADHVQRHFYWSGELTPDAADLRYLDRANETSGAIVGESARWGDVLRSQPYTPADWQAEVQRLSGQYFPVRTRIVLSQLKAQGWYPSIGAPSFRVNGKERFGGPVSAGTGLVLANPNTSGTVYYTFDGSDPRIPEANLQPLPLVTLVAESAPKNVLVPTTDIGTSWRGGSEPFDDSEWTDAIPLAKRTGGVGYEAETGYGPFISYDVFLAMYEQNTTCYIRIPFTVAAQDLATFKSLTLRARCDDGFVAFLNGVEVASLNRPATLAWNSRCADRPDSTQFVDIPITDFLAALRPGNNVLAVHALNSSPTDTDFLFSAELLASPESTTDRRVSPSALAAKGPLTLDRSTRVKARVLTDQWSALNEAVFGVGPVAGSLRISELMFHPADAPDGAGDPNGEFVELTNIGTSPINLALVRFDQGIHFTFPSLDLAPGQYVLVVADKAAFESVYGKGLAVAGQYAGSLSNGGERIRLCDALGEVVEDFTYSDDWYHITDGDGFSLTVKDVKADPPGLSTAGAWRPSAHPGGTPGHGGL
jgi:hypothetical protein